jgi:hypothetical protein
MKEGINKPGTRRTLEDGTVLELVPCSNNFSCCHCWFWVLHEMIPGDGLGTCRLDEVDELDQDFDCTGVTGGSFLEWRKVDDTDTKAI